jgi:hypothetical protein
VPIGYAILFDQVAPTSAEAKTIPLQGEYAQLPAASKERGTATERGIGQTVTLKEPKLF